MTVVENYAKSACMPPIGQLRVCVDCLKGRTASAKKGLSGVN